ncbi:hypothetical protein P691DRAFT_518837 [Macrolepiota fuliginosa MF-IS2]|uniref:Uncharacterized protein n=1 Tax=Macrolepiota fuliginosa MF-IS2 TaxID=1400762 RepID=A0A9P5X1N6_9AGAR|nr:hypothetical protein P691DRAFT_518837 [Macrolepiota fuliginosa MF-IS2]
MIPIQCLPVVRRSTAFIITECTTGLLVTSGYLGWMLYASLYVIKPSRSPHLFMSMASWGMFLQSMPLRFLQHGRRGLRTERLGHSVHWLWPITGCFRRTEDSRREGTS